MDSNEVQALLESGQEGVAEWNRRRQANAGFPRKFVLDSGFFNFDYSSLDLRGIDLGGCSLVGSDLEGADLTHAHLYRTDFSGVSLERSRFIQAHLVEAQLNRARLRGARFDHADLSEATLNEARGPVSFSRAQLSRASLMASSLDTSDLSGAALRGSDLSGASLRDSLLDGADLSGACLRGADLTDASLVGANLDGADLSGADLTGAVLEEARMIGTVLEGAVLNRCSVYGISAWDIRTDSRTLQRDLNIGRQGETVITVDDLEVAQFMYLLMNNARLRGVIDTITSKVVLILGRFTAERMPVLNAIRQALRGSGFDYVPIVFDFDKPASRTTAETVATLAGMARFVIADLTDAKSVLQELREIVPASPSLPVQSLLLDSQNEPGMLDFFRRYPWFLEPQLYAGSDDLLARLDSLIRPAVEMSSELRGAAVSENRESTHD